MAKCIFKDSFEIIESQLEPTSGREAYLYNISLPEEDESFDYVIMSEAFRRYRDGELILSNLVLKNALYEVFVSATDSKSPLFYSGAIDKEKWGKSYKLVDLNELEFSENFDETAYSLLKCIQTKAVSSGSSANLIGLGVKDLILHKINISNSSEALLYLKYFEEQKMISLGGAYKTYMKEYIKNERHYNVDIINKETEYIRLEAGGMSYLAKNKKTSSSSTVFLAMAFTDNDNVEWDAGNLFSDVISKVLKEFELKCVRIDQTEFNSYIMDQVISGIDECLFCISDLSFNKNGVYFEAGLAKGMGKQLILTCNSNDLHKNNRHFDLQQFNTIFWDDLEEFEKKIKARVRATIFDL